MVEDKLYTVMIVPQRSSRMRRYTISARRLVLIALGTTFVVAGCLFAAVHYLYIVDEAAKNRVLKEENVELKAQLRVVQGRVARIKEQLQRMSEFSDKVRTITRLNDPERNLAIGPLSDHPQAGTPTVLYAPGERIDYEDELPDSKLALRLIESQLDAAESEALSQERGMRELQDYFATEKALLASTPSIRPIASKLLNSTFGMRTDPYTGQRVMHKGIDFAADYGSDVLATADGVVVFAGNRGKYGKVIVIDHGFALQTHYTHLSGIKVEVGQRVVRGQVVAGAGNTGRTTGVHLHYEVRHNGIPQDPETFLLD